MPRIPAGNDYDGWVRELARSQGYAGARWPKMVGPEGRDSPSSVGPLLVWQQPHPIFYAELCYLSRPTRATLRSYRRVVFESAEFMASFAYFERARRRYVLGPPLIPAQENHPARETCDLVKPIVGKLKRLVNDLGVEGRDMAVDNPRPFRGVRDDDAGAGR